MQYSIVMIFDTFQKNFYLVACRAMDITKVPKKTTYNHCVFKFLMINELEKNKALDILET